MVAANNNISDNYDAMLTFSSIRKILLKILPLIISAVLMKGQSKFVTSVTWAPDGHGAGSEPYTLVP